MVTAALIDPFTNRIMKESITSEAATAIDKVIRAHVDEIDEALAPYGLSGSDICLPTYERVIGHDEAPIFAELARRLHNRGV